MNRTPSVGGMIGAAAICALLVLGVSTIYKDRVRQKEHEERINTITTVIDSMKTAPFAEERIINLPEDGGKWYTTVFIPSDNRFITNDREMDNRPDLWFNLEPRLRQLKDQTHFTVYDSTSQMYQNRFRGSIGDQLPCIVVQTPDGNVCYKASGTSIPRNASVLADQIAKSISNCFPRPKPDPVPGPTPSPVPTPAPFVPDTPLPSPPSDDSDAMTPILIVVAAIAGAAIKGISDLRKLTSGV